MALNYRIIDDRIEKSIKGRQIRHNLCWSVCSGCCTGPAAPTDHICTPHLAGREEGGGRRVRQGSTGLAPLPLDFTPTQFFIAAILLWESNDVGIVLFYSFIYNSVHWPMFILYVHCTRTIDFHIIGIRMILNRLNEYCVCTLDVLVQNRYLSGSQIVHST